MGPTGGLSSNPVGFLLRLVLRVLFLIDGFNVYHSLIEALKKPEVRSVKWLDYWRLCDTLRADSPEMGKGSELVGVHYFSALARHRTDKGVPLRHIEYINALKTTGVKVTLGNFKNKTTRCKADCKKTYTAHEEKETDVNIAVELFKSFHKNACDTVVILSGDTDLVSAVREARLLFADKKVGIGFPYNRSNAAFKPVSDFTFNIKVPQYERHQFPDIVSGPNGAIKKPPGW